MRRMSVSKQMGNGAWNRGERAGSAGCEAAGPGAGPFRARVELLAGRALPAPARVAAPPAPARVAAPPATNENVRKSMRGNKRADTRPELVVRARLRARGFRATACSGRCRGIPTWPGRARRWPCSSTDAYPSHRCYWRKNISRRTLLSCTNGGVSL